MKTYQLGSILALLTAGSLLTMPLASAPATVQPAAYVDQITWFEQPNQAQALLDLESGAMDMYFFQLRTITDIQAAQANPNLITLDTDGSINNMLFNPVPTNQSLAPGEINPFAVREVREAMNYLMDRNFIADQIFGGAAFPHTTVWWPKHPEYAREAVFMADEERQYAYSPTKAADLLATGMAKAGAILAGGKWTYNGNPINLNLVQRTEDARFDIGNYVASQLQSAGFDVTLIPRTGGGAFAIVYNGPPDQACSGCTDGGPWHAYTEGWAATALVAWDDGTPHFYYNGGEGSNIWNFYQPETFPLGSLEQQLGSTARKLLEADYDSLQERQTLIREAVDLSLKNSVRVWLITGATFAVHNRVKGFVYDLTGGLWSLYTARSARFDTTGGNLLAGQRLMFVASWSPWKGFGWLYDALQWQVLFDPALWPHPHSGLNIPIRTDFSVATAGPTGTMAVPNDAMLWNNTAMDFVNVGTGVAATSKVTFNYTFNKWHNGQDINMNDVLHEISLWGRFAAGGDIYGADADSANTAVILFNDLAKGIKVVDQDTLDVYVDYWHPDPASIAGTAAAFTCGGNGCTTIMPSVPWEVSELAMQVVLDNWLDISEDSAAAEGVDALDLSKGNSLGYLDRERTTPGNYTGTPKPPGFTTRISDTEATNRWAALDAWRAARGHYLVSNGPFYLDTVDTANAQTIMKRVNVANLGYDYPFQSDKWDAMLTPKIPTVDIQTVPEIVPGLPTNVTVLTKLAGAPYDLVEMSWQMTTGTGETLINGPATGTGNGTWILEMSDEQTASLLPGSYTLKTITVGQEAAIPVFTEKAVTVIPTITFFEKVLAEETNELRNQFQTDIDALETNLAAARSAADSAQGLANTLTIGLVVAIVVAVVAIILNFLSTAKLNKRLTALAPSEPSPPSLGGEPPKT